MDDVHWQYSGMRFVAGFSKMSTTKHRRGLDFKKVCHVFTQQGEAISDPTHSQVEKRFLIYGHLQDGRAVVVGFSMRRQEIRIHTARFLTRLEERSLALCLRSEQSRELDQETLWRRERELRAKTKAIKRKQKIEFKEQKIIRESKTRENRWT